MEKLAQLTILSFILLLSSCSKHDMHRVSFYKKLGSNAHKDGFHANETERILDFKEENKASHEAETEEKKDLTKENLNKLNTPNQYNSRTQKTKRKRFSFYM